MGSIPIGGSIWGGRLKGWHLPCKQDFASSILAHSTRERGVIGNTPVWQTGVPGSSPGASTNESPSANTESRDKCCGSVVQRENGELITP